MNAGDNAGSRRCIVLANIAGDFVEIGEGPRLERRRSFRPHAEASEELMHAGRIGVARIGQAAIHLGPLRI
jgi:hypothetical protein